MLILIISILVAMLAVSIVVWKTFWGLAPLLAGVLLVFSFRRPIWLLYIILCWIPLQYFWTSYYLGILPDAFVLIDDGILYLLFAVVFMRVVVTKEYSYKVTAVDKAVWFFTGYSVVLALADLVSPMTAFMGLRSFLQYYLLYVVVKALPLNERSYQRIGQILLVTLLAQCALTLYQVLCWKPLFINELTGGDVNQYGLSHYDAAVGTFGFGAANLLGCLMAMAFFVCVMLYFTFGKKYLFLVASAVVVLIMTSSKGVSFLLGGMLLVMSVPWVKKYGRRAWMLLAGVVVVGGIAGVLFFVRTGYDVRHVFDMTETIEQQWRLDRASSGRLAGLQIAHDLLEEKSSSVLFGLGPGSFTGTSGQKMKGNQLYQEVVLPLDSHRAITESSVVPLLVEYGYLGAMLFLGVLLMMIKECRRTALGVTSKMLSALADGGYLVFILFVVSGILLRSWEMQYVAGYVWLFLGILQSMKKNEMAI